MKNSVFSPFTTFLLQFGMLPKEVTSLLEEKLTRSEFPKRHILVKKGSVCHRLYFIEKGLARNYFEKDGKELTNDIVMEGQLLVSFSSFLSGQPSVESIEILEDSIIHSLHFNDLQLLYKQFPIMERTGRLIAEHHYKSLSEKNYMFRFNNATERYLNLFNNRVGIIQRAPIGAIASYLGMSMETLSRIRSKLE